MKITDLIPQRPPFLFVDEVLEHSEKKISTSYKVRGDEYFFRGHFPDMPVMPGVLLQEATFQTGAALIGTMSATGGKIGVVTKVENVRFKDLVVPGDQLTINVELTESLANAYYFKGEVVRQGKKVAVMNFTCALIDRS